MLCKMKKIAETKSNNKSIRFPWKTFKFNDGTKVVSDHCNQVEILLDYLENRVATASMISEATGIPQKNICRYKRKLEKEGRLFELYKSRCKFTGRLACYLSLEKNKFPLFKQLTFFND